MPSNLQVRRRHVEATEGTLRYMQSLTERARRANRHTQEGTGDYLASKELTMMLGFLVKQRMVPVRYLARQLDISPSAITQRIQNGERKNWV
jgi:DNA-binding MarR family transcriptional regulator